MNNADTYSGNGARRKAAIASIAVLMAVCMLSLPFSVSFDSDAVQTGSDGYAVRISADADHDELINIGYDEFNFIYVDWEDALDMVGMIVGIPSTITMGSHSLNDSEGSSFFGQKYTYLYATEYDYRNITFTYNSLSTKIIDVMFAAQYPEYASAVETFFGKTSYGAGDILKITGDISGTHAYKETVQYESASGGKYLSTNETYAKSCSVKADLTVTFTPDGGEAKTITLHLDANAYCNEDYTMNYGKNLSEVTAGDKVQSELSSHQMGFTGTNTVTVDGTDYSLGQFIGEPKDHERNVDLCDSEDLLYDTLSDFLDGKSPTSHISFNKGYAAAENQYNKLSGQSNGGELNIILIAGAGAAIAAVAVAALFLMRKKRA